VITRQQAEAADYNLSPSRWVGQSSESVRSELPDLIRKIASQSREEAKPNSTLDALLSPLLEEMQMPNHPEWASASIRELTTTTLTWNPTSEPRESIKYIDVSTISRELTEISGTAEIPSDVAPSRARKIVEAGNTIFATIRPSLKRVAQVPTSLDGEIASTAFCVLRPDRALIDPDFLFFAVSQDDFVTRVASLETGASYPAVRDGDIFEQQLSVPPMQEQVRIARALTIVRKNLLYQERKREVLEELFKILLHKLMGGEVRVSDLDLSALDAASGEAA